MGLPVLPLAYSLDRGRGFTGTSEAMSELKMIRSDFSFLVAFRV